MEMEGVVYGWIGMGGGDIMYGFRVGREGRDMMAGLHRQWWCMGLVY